MESQSVYLVFTSDYYFGGDWYGTEFTCTKCSSKQFVSKMFANELEALAYQYEWEMKMRPCCKLNINIIRVEVPMRYEVYSRFVHETCSTMEEVEDILNTLKTETIIRERHLWYEKEKDKSPSYFYNIEVHVVMTSNFQRLGAELDGDYMQPELKIFLLRSEADEYVMSVYGGNNKDVQIVSKRLDIWH